ncbi:MAG: YncE family protein [Bacteroidia bacterium]
MKNSKIFIMCILLMSSQFAKSQSNYSIINKISIEGDGGWDYLFADEATNRVYISHSTQVQVLDVAAKKVVGTISDLKGVHGIAVANDLNKGFISNGKDSSVTVFDLKTFSIIVKVNIAGRNPDAILYDEFSHRVFTFNGGSDNASVLDAKTNKVLGMITLDGKPEFSVTDGKGKIYVNIEDKSMVKMINPATMKVEKEWSVSPGQEPSGLAYDKANQRLFSVCDNKMMAVSDALTGKVITTLPIGERVDGAAFDSQLKRAYSSNGDGTMTVVQQKDKDTYEVLENVATQKGARTIAVNTKTNHLFLPTAEYGETPAVTEENKHPRPSIKPGSFVILEIAPTK